MHPQHSLLRLAAITLLLTLFPLPYTPRPLPVAQAETTQDRKAEGDRLLHQGTQQYQTSQFGAAIESCQQALEIYREIHNRQGEGWALVNLGLAYDSLGNDAKAIEYEQQALVIARAIQDRESEGAALVNLGKAYLNLGNAAKAIEYEQQALVIARVIQDRESEGAALVNLGNAYLNLGNYTKAIEYHQQALVIVRAIKDRQAEGEALGNLGNAYFNLGNYAQAIEYHQQALGIVRAIKNRQAEGAALGNLGNAYLNLGNYTKAIESAQQNLAIARAIKDRRSEGAALGNLGNAYRSLGNYAQAIEYHQQALGIARAIQDRQDEGRELGNLGVAYEALGNDAKAIESAQQSLVIARAIKDRRSEGAALGNLGNAYLNLGNNDAKAIEYYQQWLMIARAIKDRQAEGTALGNLGSAYSSLGNDAKAIEYTQQWLVIARAIKDRQSEGSALNNLGNSFLKAGQLPAAAQSLRAAIQVWESLRQDLGTNDAFKVSLFEEQSKSYRTLQTVLIAQQQPMAALETAERGRARALVELLSKQVSSGQPSTISHPQLVSSPSLAQIRQIAKVQKATLVEYSVIYEDFKGQKGLEARDSALYIWVIPPNGQITFRSVDLKPLWQQQNTTLAALVRHSRAAIGVSDRGLQVVALTPADLRQLQAEHSRYLKQLHQLLIEPIADFLPGDPTAHVIFMPQASLFLVPFAALQDKTDHFLIQQHTLSLAPAIQVLGLTHQRQQALKPATSVLVAGNPTMPQVTVPGADAPLFLPNLPGAKQEALDVAKALNTTALTGKQATKHTIVQQMQTARIIHLATHGLLDDFKGLGVPGAIALAPDGTGQPNDGLLTADDLLGLKLNAELVVLSACNTGQGTLTGDGVIGLSRSLMAAGTPSVIVSLWSVPDTPTASLMTAFYHNWQTTHMDKAQALRQAMLTTMQSHPDPLDWAAFTLIGEAQ